MPFYVLDLLENIRTLLFRVDHSPEQKHFTGSQNVVRGVEIRCIFKSVIFSSGVAEIETFRIMMQKGVTVLFSKLAMPSKNVQPGRGKGCINSVPIERK